MPAGQPSVRATSRSTSPGSSSSASRPLRNSPASAGVKRRSSARSSSSSPWARSAASGSAGSARVESTSCVDAGRWSTNHATVARACGARDAVEVVEDQDHVAGLGELVDEPRQQHLAQRRRGGRGRERLVRQRRARAGERLDGVAPQHDRVVVAVVEREPCDRALARLALPPGGQQRRLAEAGRAGDEREPAPAAVAQALEQPLALDGLRRHDRRVQLRDEQGRVHAREHAISVNSAS